MKRSVLYNLVPFLLCFHTSLNIHSQETIWTVTNKSVVFTIKNAKLPVKGSFEGLMAKIIFDPGNLKTASFSATILASTIKTGIEMRDKHLKRAEYFNVEKFPEITLKSNKVELVKDNDYIAKCTLVIKGITKEVDLPFKFTNTGKNAVFTGSLSINRLDFGIGSSSVIMANNLQVAIEVSAIKK
jgi:polyisoprenoid-binding protein YceI